MRTILACILMIASTKLLVAQNMGSNEKLMLWGEYKVAKFYNGYIHAMTKTEAQNWIGKTVSFHDSIYFNLANSIRTKNGFSFTHCKINKELQVKKTDFDKFLSDYKTSPKSLGFTSKVIKYITLNTCEYSPFSSIYIKENGNLIISWDGVFFELIRMARL